MTGNLKQNPEISNIYGGMDKYDQYIESEKKLISYYNDNHPLEIFDISFGLGYEIDAVLEINSITKGWALPLIDHLAIDDFVRASYKHKLYDLEKKRDKIINSRIKEIVKYSLRCYIPSEIYALVVAQEFQTNESLNKKIKIQQTNVDLEDILKKYPSIEEYNNSFEIKPINIVPEYEGNLKTFSWSFHKIDFIAASKFREIYKFEYNNIIKSALRFYLSKHNYDNAKEILDIMNRQDKERIY